MTHAPAMRWDRLMSARRLASPESGGDDRHRRPFEIDGDRIVYAAEWRRLGAKTQVHEPDPGGLAVRSRLTHSLEVSRVGRSLGQMVGGSVVARHGLRGKVMSADIAHAVAAAGLAHDIGNPPFGHAGEHAISDFFLRGSGSVLLAGVPEPVRGEFANCDGNAQGFRIVTRLTGWRPVGGLQLTAATLAAMVKYPHSPGVGAKPQGRRKYGFYAAEADMFAEVAAEVGLVPAADGSQAWCRHPLVYLLEAADDLCYLVVDVVDAALVGDLSWEEAVDLLAPLCAGLGAEFAAVPGRERKLEYLQSKAIGRLAKDCSQAFLDAEASILCGRPVGNLVTASPVAAQMALVAKVSEERIYNAPTRHLRERLGAAVLGCLLEEISGAMLEREEFDGAVSPAAKIVLDDVWGEEGPPAATGDRYAWMRAMLDAIMGMTDARAERLALRWRPELADGFAVAASGEQARALPRCA